MHGYSRPDIKLSEVAGCLLMLIELQIEYFRFQLPFEQPEIAMKAQTPLLSDFF